MRIVVYPHHLGMGGSQLNAIELAAAVRDLDHEVTVFGQPGELCGLIDSLGLPFVESPRLRERPTPSVMSALCRLARDRVVDLVHGYEWPPILEAAYGPGLRLGTATHATVMSMSVAPFLPRHVPLVVGTEQIRRAALADRGPAGAPVDLIEPPVDTHANAPGAPTPDAVDGFRATAGLRPRDLHVVVVGRLADELKLEGLLTAIDVVGRLARQLPTPMRLVIVGDGPARARVEERAAAAGAGLETPPVVLTGALLDPRPAYETADIMLGMGGSALRALAFAKPLVVQGEAGFWETLTPDSTQRFLEHGWYGLGDGAATGAARLESALRPLLADADARARLGRYGRELVEARFSLTRAARTQVGLYQRALRDPRPRDLLALARGAGGVARYQAARRYRRMRGTAAVDDFNSRAAMRIRASVPAGSPPGTSP
ncbi:glycosyltransferase family 4 protein [Frankia sp. CNm7]|uniref:Glycosyltransferase family 4 protein n=1 Tax=Frankia nepalensis TaxID=1836974 RepID=A0A937RG22_9ACTN|nr:glycosyltransferase family 4 protein [Frankia nepalensis]MBL7502416.1 glycosyltransferase family 4 protein [Frankia nepalensis]MBL7516254.1 glycosyltransferase family 4 protein [Frankia nepalensis]MBL7520110.1 glycosyltransferase family 4 protein [Frankia nepalensis]MBL7625718.1 glycosyltransferase family 4 protein [Frankia nepalensis]